MSKNKHGVNLTELPGQDSEKEVWKHILEQGVFIPTNMEEVELMEEIIKTEGRESRCELPDVENILARKDLFAQVEENYVGQEGELYALAARKGDVISEEAREKMDLLKKNIKKKI